jgi:hypothetical protein
MKGSLLVGYRIGKGLLVDTASPLLRKCVNNGIELHNSLPFETTIPTMTSPHLHSLACTDKSRG